MENPKRRHKGKKHRKDHSHTDTSNAVATTVPPPLPAKVDRRNGRKPISNLDLSKSAEDDSDSYENSDSSDGEDNFDESKARITDGPPPPVPAKSVMQMPKVKGANLGSAPDEAKVAVKGKPGDDSSSDSYDSDSSDGGKEKEQARDIAAMNGTNLMRNNMMGMPPPKMPAPAMGSGAMPPPAPARDGMPPPAPAREGMPPPAPVRDGMPPPAPARDGMPPPPPAKNAAMPPPAPAKDGMPPPPPSRGNGKPPAAAPVRDLLPSMMPPPKAMSPPPATNGMPPPKMPAPANGMPPPKMPAPAMAGTRETAPSMPAPPSRGPGVPKPPTGGAGAMMPPPSSEPAMLPPKKPMTVEVEVDINIKRPVMNPPNAPMSPNNGGTKNRKKGKHHKGGRNRGGDGSGANLMSPTSPIGSIGDDSGMPDALMLPAKAVVGQAMNMIPDSATMGKKDKKGRRKRGGTKVESQNDSQNESGSPAVTGNGSTPDMTSPGVMSPSAEVGGKKKHKKKGKKNGRTPNAMSPEGLMELGAERGMEAMMALPKKARNKARA